jgi:4-hydroxybenzoate polyprenyltransferase
VPEKGIQENIPLCVDLDGTLIASDSLAEAILLYIKKNPLNIFLIPFWLIRGKYYFKQKVTTISQPNTDYLPYRQDVLEYLKQEKESGRDIILVTASMKNIADSVAAHLGLFSRVIASDNGINIKGKTKAAILEKEYGKAGFDYAGDSKADLPVWQSARNAILVYPSKKIQKKAESISNITKIFNEKRNKLKLFVKEIRIYQWVKNILLFLPLLMAHKVTDLHLFLNVFEAFLAFGFIASSVYITNDLMDLESDRHHPNKRNRPLASGNFSISFGLILVPLLLIAGFGISIYFLPPKFTLSLVLYLLLTSAYSFYLKKIYIIDILILSSLYTLRIIAGTFAVDVAATPWLLAFSAFFFLNLAIVKRFTELLVMENDAKGRGYIYQDIEMLKSIGPSSGYISVLVFALYVHSGVNLSLYNHPQLLWAVAPFLLYWVTRIWFLANRGKMHDDPIVFTGKDPFSYAIGLIITLLVIGASL